MQKLIIKVKEIKEQCPFYRLGDKIVLNGGYQLNLKETDRVCMHSLSSILPYYNALFHEADPRKLGLSKDENKAFVQCLDPCQHTGGGTVIFEITREGR